jgi:hypothetical protein
MFCMYKFISAAKTAQLLKKQEQEMRRLEGVSRIGRSGAMRACPLFQLFSSSSQLVTKCRYAYMPLQHLDSEPVLLP